MLLRTMLANAFRAAFEDAVKALKGIGVNVATAVFASAVIDVSVARKILVLVCVLARFVGHDRRFLRNVGAKDRNQISADVPLT
jgi:hypothetical protein